MPFRSLSRRGLAGCVALFSSQAELSTRPALQPPELRASKRAAAARCQGCADAGPLPHEARPCGMLRTVVAAANLQGECCARQQPKCTRLRSVYAYRRGKLARRRNDQTPPAQSTWAGWPSVVARSALRRRQHSAATSNAGLEPPVHTPRALLKLDRKGELSRPRGGLAEHARCACSLRSPVSAQKT